LLKKLRIKFILFTMCLVTVMLCVIFGTVYGFTAQKLKAGSLSRMHSLAGPPNFPAENRPKVREAYLILQQSPQGAWLVRGSQGFDSVDEEFLQTLLLETSESGDRDGVLKEYDLRFLKLDGPTAQYVFLDISSERTMLAQLVSTCCVIGAVSLVAFFGISLLLANLALRPVEQAWNAQSQFVADASHELKTPLAIIMTNAELLEDGSYSPQERRQFEKNILSMARQMRHLVEGMLELTRLDHVAPDMSTLERRCLRENSLLTF